MKLSTGLFSYADSVVSETDSDTIQMPSLIVQAVETLGRKKTQCSLMTELLDTQETTSEEQQVACLCHSSQIGKLPSISFGLESNATTTKQ